MAEPNPFFALVKDLQKFYGRPKPPKTTDALELILLENVAYLANDDKRAPGIRRSEEERRHTS